MAYAQIVPTATIGIVHRREHRWLFKGSRDGGAQCDARDGNGEVNEKIQSNFNRIPGDAAYIFLAMTHKDQLPRRVTVNHGGTKLEMGGRCHSCISYIEQTFPQTRSPFLDTEHSLHRREN